MVAVLVDSPAARRRLEQSADGGGDDGAGELPRDFLLGFVDERRALREHHAPAAIVKRRLQPCEV